MTTNNADFKIKKGLKVEGGNVGFSSTQNATVAVDASSSADTAGRTLTITGGLGTGDEAGGSLILRGGGPAGSTGTTETTPATAITIDSAGATTFSQSLTAGTVDINGGAIDGTTIGAAAARAGSFTTLSATGATSFGVDDTGVDVTFFGDTAGDKMLWDTSANRLVITGTASTVALDVDAGDFTVGAYGLTSAGAATIASMAGNWTNAGRTVADLGSITTVDINGGSIDGAVIGAASAAAGTFAAIVGTSLSLGDGSITNVGGISLDMITADDTNIMIKPDDNQADAFNITDAGGALYMKVDTTDSAPLITFDEDIVMTGTTPKLTIGDGGAEDTMIVFDGNENDFRLGVNDTATGDAGNFSNVLEIGGGSTHGAGVGIIIDGSGNIIQLGQDASPSSGEVLAYDGSKWTAAASASGADGMGSGFTVSATTDTTATTITQGDDLMFAIATNGGLTAETTADGTVTHGLDINGLSAAVLASGDFLAFSDEGTSGDPTKKESIDDIATLFAGTGLTASSAVIGVDAAQTQITSVGTLSSLTVSGAIDLNSVALDIDATGLVSIDGDSGFTVDNTTMSLDSTDTTNLTMTANSSSAKVMTIDAINSGSGAASITLGSTSGTAINIGNATSEVTIGDNLTVVGDLTVQGANTVISSTVINVDDKNIELGAVDTPSDTTADGGGITLKGATDKTIIWDDTNDNWTSNQDWNIASGKKFRINNTAVFESATQLTSTVVTSGLTTVGALNSGSITSGFGTINTGSSTITTTGAITGGSLVADNITIDTNTISSTNSNGNIVLTPNGSGLVNIAKDDLAIAGTAVTTTAAELNVLDAVTAGTVTGSLAVVVDANKDIASFRNLTATGEIQSDTFDVGGHVILDTDRASAGSITGATALATYAAATYTTAKYIYQIKKDTAVDTDVGEILITYEGTSNDVFITEYGMMSTGSSVGVWSAVYNSGTVELKFTPTTNGDHTYTILNTLLI